MRTIETFFILILFGITTTVNADFRSGISAANNGDYLTASIEFLQAAEEGDPLAQAALCTMYRGETPGFLTNPEKALPWCRMAAEKGIPQAEFYLGWHYDSGWGIPENNALSVKWFQRAAEKGFAPAQGFLGVQYGAGEGVSVDKERMIYWYRKAAEQGYVPAQSNMGGSYMRGDGVPRDKVLAAAWTILAVEKGYGDAIYNYRILQHNLSPSELAEADKLAKELKQKINAQKKPPDDLQRLHDVRWTSNPCTPLSLTESRFRTEKYEVNLPGPGGWCYVGKQTSDQVDYSAYSYVELRTGTKRAIVNLTNLEETKFSSAKEFLKYAKEQRLANRTAFPCSKKCKFKYSVEEHSTGSCVKYTRTFKGDRHFTGRGQLCTYSNDPTVLLSAELGTLTDKKPRGKRKNEILAQGDQFLNSIDYKQE